VSWPTETHTASKSRAELIGPGRLILVVGPSGAGKDTLINGARVQCAGDSTVIFPRRVVTRPSSVHEDHETVDRDTFNRRLAEGRFALWWDAHGHRYGVPVSIHDDIRSSRTVVCNVSRTIVEPARQRYARVAVVLITAPERLLEVRLASRDRRSDGDLADRVARSAEVADSCRADVSIHNVGEPMAGIRALLNVIRDRGTLS
jgi:ribose 1,5-bisphosphokinase